MRIALFARVPDVVAWLDEQLRELGHECVGVVTTEGPPGRYGDEPLSALIDVRPTHPSREPPHRRAPARDRRRGY
jgi:hypothetical protein